MIQETLTSAKDNDLTQCEVGSLFRSFHKRARYTVCGVQSVHGSWAESGWCRHSSRSSRMTSPCIQCGVSSSHSKRFRGVCGTKIVCSNLAVGQSLPLPNALDHVAMIECLILSRYYCRRRYFIWEHSMPVISRDSRSNNILHGKCGMEMTIASNLQRITL